jgi:hypothetical protein
MVDKTRRPTRQDAENADRKSARSVLRVTLPTFAILVLRQRAKGRRLTVSAVVETLILEAIMTNELQVMALESPEFGRMAEEWLRGGTPEER